MSAHDDLVAAISRQVPDVRPDQVAAVLQQWQSVLDADQPGMVRRHDDGRVAHRVEVDGVPLWRVSSPDGGQYNDMAARLDWPAIFNPSEVN